MVPRSDGKKGIEPLTEPVSIPLPDLVLHKNPHRVHAYAFGRA
jgi:hypothetical protein